MESMIGFLREMPITIWRLSVAKSSFNVEDLGFAPFCSCLAVPKKHASLPPLRKRREWPRNWLDWPELKSTVELELRKISRMTVELLTACTLEAAPIISIRRLRFLKYLAC